MYQLLHKADDGEGDDDEPQVTCREGPLRVVGVAGLSLFSQGGLRVLVAGLGYSMAVDGQPTPVGRRPTAVTRSWRSEGTGGW